MGEAAILHLVYSTGFIVSIFLRLAEPKPVQLLLDIGNSKIKWGLLNEQQPVFNVASHAYREEMIEVIAGRYWADISPNRVVAANVAGPDLAAQLHSWVEKTWHIPVEFLVPRRRAGGVVNGYLIPEQLGADRWAALIGAAQHPHGHLCIVDCGTALTIDILTADNQHQGGLIIPGRELMRRALLTGTAQVRDTRGDNTRIFGGDTGSAVAGGILYTMVALIDRVQADLAAELDAPVAILLSGGEAALLAPLLAGPINYQPHLVLDGLAVIAQSFLE